MKHSSARGSRQADAQGFSLTDLAKLSFRGSVTPLYDTAHALTARRSGPGPNYHYKALSPITHDHRHEVEGG